MDVWEARAVLGIADADGWDAIRAAYRRLIRQAHPDAVGVEAGTTPAAARLNAAYTTLSRAKRAGTLDDPRPAHAQVAHAPGGPGPGGAGAPAPVWQPPPPPRVGVVAAGTDTLLLAAPPDEAFARLLDAGHRVGSVTYVDRSCAIFELVVRLDGESCSLVVTLQGRAHGTEAFLTLESMERVASYSPEPVLHALAEALTGG
jgi:DnaJ domain